MSTSTEQSRYHAVFYANASGREIAREWLRDLSQVKRSGAGHYVRAVLQDIGPDVCGTRWGKNLGGGLMEFRIDSDEPPGNRAVSVLLRVFFHPFGDRNLLLLDGYDKGENPSPIYQNKRISSARGYLKDFQLRVLPTLSI